MQTYSSERISTHRDFLRNIFYSSCTYLGRGSGGRSFQHLLVGHLHSEISVINQRPRPLHSTRLILVVKRLQVGVAEQTAVPETLPAVVGTLRGRRRGRGGGGPVVGAGVGAAAGVLGAVVPHLQRVQQTDGGVELEVAPTRPGGGVDAMAVGRQNGAEGRSGLRLLDSLLFHLHVVYPSALVQLARRTPTWKNKVCQIEYFGWVKSSRSNFPVAPTGFPLVFWMHHLHVVIT